MIKMQVEKMYEYMYACVYVIKKLKLTKTLKKDENFFFFDCHNFRATLLGAFGLQGRSSNKI